MKRKIFFPFLLFIFPFIVSSQTTAKEWYSKGVELKGKKDYEGALTAFKNTILKKADYNEAYYEAGWCCNELENYEEAIDHLKKYMPYYEIEEDYDNAIEYFEKAVKEDEEDSKPIYYKLGWLYNDQERYDDAVKILLKAIEYDREDSGYREELGYAYYQKEEYEFALTELNKAIALDDASKLGYYYKGLCFVATNRKGEAMSMYYKLKELDSDSAG